MTIRNRAADHGWLTFHIVGVLACHLFDLWVPYWAIFAFVELVGIVWGAPMTTSTRGWLSTGERWKFGVVLAWCFWISGTFGMYAPLPLWARGVIVLGFYIWVTRHFRDNVVRRRAA
jgi:apolipoprotein N-acyltransferase